jgi:bifunctional UDP-N-acetylglucosamine pyrophosphorylase/glucosamine-1-phosphate N-acetyltransferase
MMAGPLYEGRTETDVRVVAGDMPLFQGPTLAKLVGAHRDAGAAGSLATSALPDPAGYGRICRDDRGNFTGIVEHKDATDDQRKIREVNISCYCFDSRALFDALAQVRTDNVQGEYYLTDVLGLMRRSGRTVQAMRVVPADQAEGVNDPEQLARVDHLLRERLATSKEGQAT